MKFVFFCHLMASRMGEVSPGVSQNVAATQGLNKSQLMLIYLRVVR